MGLFDKNEVNEEPEKVEESTEKGNTYQNAMADMDCRWKGLQTQIGRSSY